MSTVYPQADQPTSTISKFQDRTALLSAQLPPNKIPKTDESSASFEGDSQVQKPWRRSPALMKNKTPRWHEQLQCWCLNFHGRVTVASVKNFQLVEVGEEETVLLQFGKCGDNVFAMDYRYPLSAFQAFTICLTSFGMKIACE
ncbi:hypothetical protein HPP92_024570 [Vanilla planifolia]|uniref:Tubby C-terminal domain-containing protein n=1 Tax=Vanilla planifolia TaxID=51239 RepID=A0A835PM72_VANPL|nr:hypothetical protein HPP92_024570 [Vanilla planifolia]